MARLGRVGSGMVQDPEVEWKILALGEGGVGKSSFLIQFVDSVFIDEYDPTIEDSFRRNIPVDGIVCALDILDTAGFNEMRNQHIGRAEGILMFYSITSRPSFDKAKTSFEYVRFVTDLDYVPWVLIGNKCDLVDERDVTTEEGIQLAEEFRAPFFETSAKDRTNVYEAVEALVRKTMESASYPSLIRHKPNKRRGCILL